MTESDEFAASASLADDVAAAIRGDEEAFRQLCERYRRELHVYCYRILGSFHDAEDALQETFLRSWRYRHTFAGSGTYRSWLYRIATNVCLTAATRRRAEGRVTKNTEVRYLTPYPDSWLETLEEASTNPAAAYDLRESVQLAFVAAVQVLPPRQRAVLILRDVLGWRATDVARLLDATPASVNSALQRARTALARIREIGPSHIPCTARDEVEDDLVRRYVEAWESLDMDRLVGLLRADAVLSMPPLGLRFYGREAISHFFATNPYPGAMADMRLVPARANRQPAYGVYRRSSGSRIFHPVVLVVLTADGDEISQITGFSHNGLFPLFGLPPQLDADEHSRLSS